MFRRGAFFAAALLLAGVVRAEPLLWAVSEGGTGHWYEFVAAPNIDWEAAAASAATYNSQLGAMGALLVIESAEENAWVLANVATSPNAWIGLKQALEQPPVEPCGFEPDLQWWWTWPWFGIPVYTNWCPGQPDDGGVTECFLVPHQQWGMMAAGGCWTDELANYAVSGYLVEYESQPVPTERVQFSHIKMLYR
jgi:hypothetical protein